MYDSPTQAGAGTAAGAGVLASTGIEILWYVVAGIALIGLGAALLRFLPKKED